MAILTVTPRQTKSASAPAQIGVCVGAGILANLLTTYISDAVGNSGLAVPVSEGAMRRKEGILDIAARCTARQLFDGGISGMLDIVRKQGRDGEAAYVKDWRNFQTSAEYRGEDIFRAMLSKTKLCDYFSKDIKTVFGATNQKALPSSTQTRVSNFDPFVLRANCTLPSNFKIEEYQKDFVKNGGWQAFSRLLEPQNNYYGVLFSSLNEAEKQRELEKTADTNEALSGQGYTAKRKACQSVGQGARCVVLGTILTPGATLSGAVNSTFQSELAWLANSDEINEVIATLTERFVNRLLDISKEDSEQKYGADPSVPEPPPGGGGGGPCADTGTGTPNHAGALSDAMDAVIDSNPEGIADELNTTENGFKFLEFVAGELNSSGYIATTSVLNGNGNPNTGDIIAVWRPGEITMERYDAIVSSGSGSTPLRDSTSTGFTGDIPLSCVQ